MKKKRQSCKKIYFLIIIGFIFGVISYGFTSQASESYNGVGGTYYYTVSNGEATIVGYSYKYNYFEPDVPKVPKIVENKYPVTKIADGAFANATDLPGLIIQDGVKSIGASAFSGCSKLTNITLPDSVKSIGASAFSGCSNLSYIILPNSITSIENNTFFNCNILWMPKLPDSVKSIGDSAFSGCRGLQLRITSSSSLMSIGEKAFMDSNVDEISIPDEMTSIGDATFKGCSLGRISIPNSVTRIGKEAFSGCDLKEISIPDSVTDIGIDAFYRCPYLESVILSKSIARISRSMFTGCVSLTSINIPDSVTTIDEGAFWGCTSLKDINISNGVTNIGNYAFYQCPWLTSITIPDSVTKFGYCVFAGCNMLRNVTLPKTITCIPSGTFVNCFEMKSIEIPNGVTCIEKDAFDGCRSLKDVWYGGTMADRVEMTVEDGNTPLKDATWHYPCEEAGHSFAMNHAHTCEYCGYSKKPQAPVLESKTNNCVTLVANTIYEYSMDGENWQDSNVFSGLACSTTYVFYQRVKANETTLVSGPSEGLTVVTKSLQTPPAAPILSSYTDTTVTLIAIENGEYSNDNGTTWQSENIFTGLSAGNQYTFYQRYAETDTHGASDKSQGTTVTTDKSKQTKIPPVPIMASCTASTIVLNAIDGCEYSKDGITWQTSVTFGGLSCGTEYTFYQRYAETTTTHVGQSSEGAIFKTDKGTQSAPSAPTLESKSHNKVVLTAISGYEYSKDGINWQTSNVFTALNPETNYLFYQRKAENDIYYASTASTSLIVKTEAEPEIQAISYTPNKTIYHIGEPCDILGDILDVIYSSQVFSDEQIVIDDSMISGFDTSTAGIKTVIISYMGYTTKYKITVQDHYYDDAYDATCNACSYIRQVSGTWKKDSAGWWYQNPDGSYPYNCWKLIDGVWYYFNASGYILTGWQSIGGTWYYFNGSGAMLTGWQSIGGTWYYFNGSGAMATGWQSIGGTWYYFNGSGAMLTGWQSIGGTWYYFNGSGAMVTGWQSIGGTWYYFNGSGAMATGWQSIGGTWYYFNGSGAMATGWQSIGGIWYYFNGSGAMVTGWQSIGGAWYYFEGSGAMVTNRWVGNYYLQADGTMATNTWIGSYYVGSDGVWIP